MKYTALIVLMIAATSFGQGIFPPSTGSSSSSSVTSSKLGAVLANGNGADGLSITNLDAVALNGGSNIETPTTNVSINAPGYIEIQGGANPQRFSGGGVTLNGGVTINGTNVMGAIATPGLGAVLAVSGAANGSPITSAGNITGTGTVETTTLRIGYTNNMNGVRVNVTPVDIPGYFGYLDGAWTYSSTTNFYTASFTGDAGDVQEYNPGVDGPSTFKVSVGKVGMNLVGLELIAGGDSARFNYIDMNDLSTEFLRVENGVTTIPSLQLTETTISSVTNVLAIPVNQLVVGTTAALLGKPPTWVFLKAGTNVIGKVPVYAP
jgi:hypothetical protein